MAFSGLCPHHLRLAVELENEVVVAVVGAAAKALALMVEVA